MKSKFLITLLLTFTLVLAACAPASNENENNENNGSVSTPVIPVTGDTATSAPTMAPTEAMTATEAPTSTEATTATEAPTNAATQPSVGFGTATAVTVKVSNQGTAPFLVDDQGRALYIYAKDTGGTSACTDTECTSEWPAVLVTGTPTAGDGVDATLLGTITRDDGQMQATYNNHPLYYYSKDVNPGDTTGVGVDPDWTLVSPTGDPIK